MLRPLGSTAFDSAPLPAGVRLDAAPELAVVLDLLAGTGNPALSAVLSHCAPGGTGCVPLAEGSAVDGNRSTPEAVRYRLVLAPRTAVQTVPPGRALRLELVRPVGSKGSALVLVGAPGPLASRLVLP